MRSENHGNPMSLSDSLASCLQLSDESRGLIERPEPRQMVTCHDITQLGVARLSPASLGLLEAEPRVDCPQPGMLAPWLCVGSREVAEVSFRSCPADLSPQFAEICRRNWEQF